VQCTPDLSHQECSKCLQMISAQIPVCCVGQDGARYYTPSCNFRYESYPFFDLTAAPLSPPVQVLYPPPMKGTPILLGQKFLSKVTPMEFTKLSCLV